MSQGFDARSFRPRLTPTRVNLLIVLGLIAFQALLSLTAPRWARLLQRPMMFYETENGDEPRVALPARSGPTPEVRRTINVKLFFEAMDRSGLVLEERTVAYHADLPRQLRAVLEELIRGSQMGLGAPIDQRTRVLDVLVSARGVAYVDLSPEVIPSDSAGSESELLTVYSIVNTLTVNFPVVSRVQLVVGDQAVTTLHGHVDLTRPLSTNMSFLAAARTMEVAPGSEPTQSASPSDAGAGE